MSKTTEQKPPEPMKDLEVITDPKVVKLLFESTRSTIVFRYLVNRAMTVKELADALGKNPGTILHHIDKLRKAGIVVQERTELTKTGIVQRFYRATAREYRLGIGGMMEADSGVAKFAENRLESIINSLSVYGIQIPESQNGEAKELLKQLIERENQVSSNLTLVDEKAFYRFPQSVRNDASRIMRRLSLEEDEKYRELRDRWHAFLQSYRKGELNNE
ncbi:MAG: ArsR family transcriptional regulator [Candidatus Lokiarchaeota archaeon]|nr:ArsR family transcriptional regulator [Candidatus Lokiarchaeota archaeon]